MMALRKSTGSFLEFLSRKHASSAAAPAEFSVSDDSMIMGTNGSFSLTYEQNLSPAFASFNPSCMNDPSDMIPSILLAYFLYISIASS